MSKCVLLRNNRVKTVFYIFIITVIIQFSHGAIIVNEIHNETSQADEYYELVLTTDYTAAQLETYYFGDSTSATADINSLLQLQNLNTIAGTFYAGTIITISGENTIDETSYNPQPGINQTNEDAWNLNFTEPSLTYTHRLTRFGDSSTGLSGTGTNFANSGDIAFVANSLPNNNLDTSVFDTALGYDSAGGTIYDASEFQVANTIGSGDSVYNTGDASGNDDFTSGAHNTLGLPNGGDNSTWIHSLRVPEPSSFLLTLIACGFFIRRKRFLA